MRNTFKCVHAIVAGNCVCRVDKSKRMERAETAHIQKHWNHVPLLVCTTTKPSQRTWTRLQKESLHERHDHRSHQVRRRIHGWDKELIGEAFLTSIHPGDALCCAQ